ncbi:hypothetical protein SDC9_167347 [bioreactor metagenome]|uniref:Uncharacterized protein n=1 Tax=bioreactor metagenome TaxID=1076179 RepID=A0A645G203_9ZZZZ
MSWFSKIPLSRADQLPTIRKNAVTKTVAFGRLKPMSIRLRHPSSTIAMTELSAAENSAMKNRTAIRNPPVVWAKRFVRLTKVSPFAPDFITAIGSGASAKTAGSTTIPASIAATISPNVAVKALSMMSSSFAA